MQGYIPKFSKLGGARAPAGIPGHVVGPGRVGLAKSPTPKSATQARPGCRASFFCLSQARRAKIVSGRRAGPSLISRFPLPKPGLLLLSGLKFLPRPGPIACFGPTGRAIFGPGFPCPAIPAGPPRSPPLGSGTLCRSERWQATCSIYAHNTTPTSRIFPLKKITDDPRSREWICQ
jgi:hypothetical protein